MVGIWLEVTNVRSEANFLGQRSRLYVQLKGDSSDRPLTWWRVQTDLPPKSDDQPGAPPMIAENIQKQFEETTKEVNFAEGLKTTILDAMREAVGKAYQEATKSTAQDENKKPVDESTKNRTILDLAKRVEDALKDKRVVLARLCKAPDGLIDDDDDADYANSVKRTGLVVDRIRIQFSDTTTNR